MNKLKMTGIGLIGLGTVEQIAGRLLTSRHLQARGFGHRVAGQSKVAIARAMARVGGRLQAARAPEMTIGNRVPATDP